MFAFYLVALFFAVVALFTGLLALFSRLGGYISGFNTALALFFQTLAAALMTYVCTIISSNGPVVPHINIRFTVHGPSRAAMLSAPTARTPGSVSRPTVSRGPPWVASSSR